MIFAFIFASENPGRTDENRKYVLHDNLIFKIIFFV